MIMKGALAKRGEQPVGLYCPIERALQVVGTRSAMRLLREAFYGATRFDELVARSGLTETTTANQLRALVEAGLLDRRPYREPGRRGFDEYVLTQAGEDLMPALFALLQWANEYDPPPYPPTMRHRECGEPVRIVAECADGHHVGVDDIEVSAPGPFGRKNPVPA